MKSTPPKWVEKFLDRFLNHRQAEVAIGDLQEKFFRRLKGGMSHRKASALYTFESLGFIRMASRQSKHNLNTFDMLQNYLKISLRSLIRNKFYSTINISGLSVGIASCFFIALYVLDELSYDQYHEKKDRIYRLVSRSERDTQYEGIAKVNGPWGLAAKAEIAEVENMTRVVPLGNSVFESKGIRNLEANGLLADSSLFSVFSYSWISGNKSKALTVSDGVVLTPALAQKYFGSVDVVGETIEIDQKSYRITGIVEVPLNSHFTFSYLLPLSFYGHPDRDSWTRWNQFYTYVLLRPGANIREVELKMKSIVDKNVAAELHSNYHPFLQPLTLIHLHSHLFRELSANADVNYIYLFGAIGILILIISSINYINMASSQAINRSKEIGLRKVTGAVKGQLVRQFLVESVLICVIAAIFSAALVYALLPMFNTLTGKQLQLFHLINLNTVLLGVALIVAIGLAAGSYPAFFLSTLRPVEVLKGKTKLSMNLALRKGLIVFQFAIAAFLMAATAVILSQLSFVDDKNLGYDSKNLLTIPITNDSIRNHLETIKQELLARNEIEAVTVSGNLPLGGDYGIPYQVPDREAETLPTMRILVTDFDFLTNYGMKLAHGRFFSQQIESDRTTAVIINEEAAKQLGWADPIGKEISVEAIGRVRMKVIGVVKDFHFRSLKEKIAPVMFFIPPTNWFAYISVRIKDGKVNDVMPFIESKLKHYDEEAIFSFQIYEDMLGSLYQEESRAGEVISLFAAIAVIISCIGLIGLSAFTAQQRFKEIGIRKSLGASTFSINQLLSMHFVRLSFLGFLISIPFTYWQLDQWLSKFAYRVPINAWFFVGAGVCCVMVAFISVSLQTYRAAIRNPIDSLRTE